MSLKHYRFSLPFCQALTGVLFCQLMTSSPCFAGYDLSDPFDARPDSGGQVSSSGGQGTGMGGVAGKGNTNVSFSEGFSNYTINPNSKINAPFDELPIQQMQNTVTGQQIYANQASDFYMANPDTSAGSVPIIQSGTGKQIPTPLTGMNPTSTRLLAGPAAEIPHNNKLNYGFPAGVTRAYTGVNYSNSPSTQNGGYLPPTSLGSVDLNIVSTTKKIPEAELVEPATMP